MILALITIGMFFFDPNGVIPFVTYPLCSSAVSLSTNLKLKFFFELTSAGLFPSAAPLPLGLFRTHSVSLPVSTESTYCTSTFTISKVPNESLCLLFLNITLLHICSREGAATLNARVCKPQS
ncbi:hypothetical protein BB560_003031 [Smittium megazygosporum]|uniref:Uncharacterized protein n=1 Tax=Smittium megazygosporum TaxID=133381 RepID=A0A2T9ZD76_9FUNG|nr:hypothetical protein BB560_003031 [Smittium megazygosporum]